MVVAVEVMVVKGEDGGGLIPEQTRGDAEVTRHFSHPRQEDAVDYTGHRAVFISKGWEKFERDWDPTRLILAAIWLKLSV